jgi:hypothetical protein
MMIVMPVLALQSVPEGKPGDIPTGILAFPRARPQVTHAIDETLPMEREY